MQRQQYLVPTPQAQEFMTGIMSDSVLHARLGDPRFLDGIPGAAESVAQLKSLIKETGAKAKALAGDLSRGPEDAHYHASILAERAAKATAEVASKLSQKSEAMIQAGYDMAQNEFAPRPAYQAIDAEHRAYIREQVKTPDGVAKVHKLVMEKPEVAALIVQSPGYLLGLADEVHQKWTVQAINKHLPAASKMMQDGSSLAELAGKYKSFVRDIYQSFYNPALAEKYKSSRVEI
ncbi:MAG: hypothetical protein U1E34_10105 [Amaricoccus sp.]